ncbi:MAG: alpha-glucan family phosphorylase [Deltaproteobacteria bacterium]
MNHKKITLFEVSWEVCNLVGGIYTVVSSKEKRLSEKYENIIMVGPELAKDHGANKEFREDKTLFESWRMMAQDQGLKFRVGRWNIPGKPIAILVDFTSLFKDKNKIFAHFWEQYKLDSIKGDWDYIEPVTFGYAVGQVIESFYKYHMMQYETVVAQFHEWMTGSGILYLKEMVPEIGTVFTTHATALGRTIAGNNLPLYDKMPEYNPRLMASNYNIPSKYSIERISAHEADAFTTVSEITARECKYFLEKEPDIVTPNGFEDAHIPVQNEFNIKKQIAKSKLIEITEAVIGHKLAKNATFVLNSGRYEFKNKGIDVFIKALAALNDKTKKEIVGVIAVPAGNIRPNPLVVQRLNGDWTNTFPHISTHELADPNNDPVIRLMRQLKMENGPNQKVKIIFIPVYLNGSDGIVNLKYYDFLLGFDLSAFPSYYEPWGYTPLESIAYSVPTVTTSLAGFGAWIKEKLDKKNNGAYVIDRNDHNDNEVVDALAKIIQKFSTFTESERLMASIQAKDLASQALWKNLIVHYVAAYDKAISASDKRKDFLEEMIAYEIKEVQTDALDSKQPVWKKIFIKPSLPPSIKFIEELSKNLWWTWNKDAESLFKYMDPELWEEVEHNPVALIEKLSIRQLNRLENDTVFIEKLGKTEAEFKKYMSAEKREQLIAYFSMEFGLHDTVKIFSGGLGILAGDYMKEASDSNYNMIGIGLLYRFGYFKQKITLLGDQIANLSPQRFTHLPVRPVKDDKGDWLRIEISLPGRTLKAQAWKMKVGRNLLFLLDTDIEENTSDDRKITSQLYGGGTETRLLQEIVLGIGGVKMLKQMNIEPDLVHINEGHAALTGIERLRNYIQDEQMNYDLALELVRCTSLFTTHTPVPAGHDEFSEDLVRAYLPNYNDKLNMSWNDFMSLARWNPEDKNSKFSMSVLAARLSQGMNGVSQIHGEVSQEMFAPLYTGYFPNELHIDYVTNGVHLPFWVGTTWNKLYKKHFGEDYLINSLDKKMWQKIYDVPHDTIWETRNYYRTKLIEYLKKRLHKELLDRNESPKHVYKTLEGLRDDVLTIGFARRFATYKRGSLLFNNIERLKAILSIPDKPVQIIFAGKAHPNDKAGQELIKTIIDYSKSPDFAGKIFFVENYDITLAKYLVQGVDVWLNTPTRPLEASGTSGEKAIMNGVLNLSVLDGWWAEGFVQGAGWALKKERTYENQDFQNVLDALTIYDIIEDEIAPVFYERNSKGISEKWVEMIKKNIAEIVPNFTMTRMIEDYNTKYYSKQIPRYHELKKDNFSLAREIVAWKSKFLSQWKNMSVVKSEYPDSTLRPIILGEKVTSRLTLNIGELNPEEIGVEVLYGRKKEDGNVELLFVFPLKLHKVNGSIVSYQREVQAGYTGVYDFAFRIFPKNDNLPHRMDFPVVKWV